MVIFMLTCVLVIFRPVYIMCSLLFIYQVISWCSIWLLSACDIRSRHLYLHDGAVIVFIQRVGCGRGNAYVISFACLNVGDRIAELGR